MTFDELNHLLEVEDFQESASEVHGIICGRLAGGERLSGDKLREALIESLASEEELVENAFEGLAELYQSSLAELQDSNLGFKPLIPGDDKPLEKRVAGLAQWCQGFIAGLGDSGLSGDGGLSDDATNSLRDMAAITQAAFEGEGDEEDEVDFTELEEFVRVAAMLIFAERGTLAASTPKASRTLH